MNQSQAARCEAVHDSRSTLWREVGDLEAGQRVVQAWRFGRAHPSAWEPAVYSTLRFTPEPAEAGTRLTIDTRAFPRNGSSILRGATPRSTRNPWRGFSRGPHADARVPAVLPGSPVSCWLPASNKGGTRASRPCICADSTIEMISRSDAPGCRLKFLGVLSHSTLR